MIEKKKYSTNLDYLTGRDRIKLEGEMVHLLVNSPIEGIGELDNEDALSLIAGGYSHYESLGDYGRFYIEYHDLLNGLDSRLHIFFDYKGFAEDLEWRKELVRVPVMHWGGFFVFRATEASIFEYPS